MGNINSFSIEDLKKRLYTSFKKHRIIKAVVFGSYARNTENRKSDLDLILVQRTEKRFFDRYDDIGDIYENLRGVQTDILIYTPEELKRISSRPFIRKALEEGITIYGS
jgi:predicted nucleotidyltransferase